MKPTGTCPTHPELTEEGWGAHGTPLNHTLRADRVRLGAHGTYRYLSHITRGDRGRLGAHETYRYLSHTTQGEEGWWPMEPTSICPPHTHKLTEEGWGPMDPTGTCPTPPKLRGRLGAHGTYRYLSHTTRGDRGRLGARGTYRYLSHTTQGDWGRLGPTESTDTCPTPPSCQRKAAGPQNPLEPQRPS